MERKSQMAKKVLARPRLKYERERRGWTLEYVATQINCPDSQMIRRWERGTITPSPRYRQALCVLFEKNAEELELLAKKSDELPGQILNRPVAEPSLTGQHTSQSSSGQQVSSEDRFFLPAPLTSFVGREQEITTVCKMLRRAEVRLLTLTGTGGVGKTRLGMQVLTQQAHSFADGGCFLSLMETSDPDLVVPTIAHKLGLQEIGSQPLFDLLKAFLKEKQMLLLLDNFEQVIDAATILSDLLRYCPRLKILVTSRSVLRVSGEYEFFVPPLVLPDLARLSEEELLSSSSAMALFLERTRAVLPNFMLNEANARVIAEICIRLDGLPLAIELAAPHLKVLSPHLLLARLDRQLEILTNGVRDAPVRQQTLRNTLVWSYRLLDSREQRLFGYLSIFVNGCTLRAIEAIWSMLEGQLEVGQVLEDVASLLNKSMLQRSVQKGEEPRLLLLRTIREYGLESLSRDGYLEQTQWAHATYYLALAEEAEPALKGSSPLAWLECLEREYDNVREAFCYLIACAEHGNGRGTEMALRLGKALERFWFLRGHVQEGRDFLERALKCPLEASHSIRGNAMHTMAMLASLQGDLDAVEEVCEENLAQFRESGDFSGIARSLYRLGAAAQMRGKYATARTYYEESLTISRREQKKETLSEMLFYFASLTLFQGDISVARTMIEECLVLFRDQDDLHNRAAGLNILGWVSLMQGDAQAARALEEENLAICRGMGNQHGMALAFSALGYITFRAGDLIQAYICFKESLSMMMWLGDRWMVAFCLEGLSSVAVAQGKMIWAVHLLSAAAVLREVIGAAISPLEQMVREHLLTVLHEQLDEQAFTTAWMEGQTMSAEQAIAAEERPTDDLTRLEQELVRLAAQG